jgi:hypothetical protein
MIRNVTLVEFKPGTTTAYIDEITAAMRGLKISGMLHLSMGPDLSLKDGNMHYAVVADFVDTTAYRAFDEDPEHGRIRREMTGPALSRYLAGSIRNRRWRLTVRGRSCIANLLARYCYSSLAAGLHRPARCGQPPLPAAFCARREAVPGRKADISRVLDHRCLNAHSALQVC